MALDKGKLFGQLLELGMNLLKKKGVETVSKAAVKEVAKPVAPVQVKIDPPNPVAPAIVDWNNPKSKISKYFTVEEAIVLRNWNRLANDTDGLDDKVKKNLIAVFGKMDEIREILGKPIYVKSAYRPQKYNIEIGGAKQSAHMANEDYAAVDFWTDQDGDGDKDGEDCDKIKELLRPHLARLEIRMEDNGKGARWVHIDTKPVPQGGNREFKP